MNYKKRGKKTAILLFVVIALCSFPSAFGANQILEVNVSGGADGQSGIMRPNDFFMVSAVVELDNGVDPSNVLLGSSTPFDTCESQGSATLCTARFPSEGTTFFGSGEFPLTVNLKENNRNIDSKSISIFVDNQRPEVVFTSVRPRIAGNEDITFSYGVQDTACSETACDNSCSGIDYIEYFNAQNTFFESIDLDGTSCTFDDELVIPSRVFGSGSHTLLGKAFDNTGLASAVAAVSFQVGLNANDASAGILNVSFQNRKLSHVAPGKSMPVTATIRYSDLDISQVTGDFSQLSADANARSVVGRCVRTDQGSTCSFTFTLQVAQAGTKEVVINLTDSAGAEYGQIYPYQLAEDTTGPVITSMKAGISENFAQQFTPVTIEFTESGVGVDPQDMRLVVRGRSITSDSCTATTCTWNRVNIGTGSVRLSIDTTSTDRLGNTVDEFDNTFVVSRAKPSVASVDIQGVGGLTGAIASFPVLGDRIGVTANITSQLALEKGVADFSTFISDDNELVGACTVADEQIQCSWLSNPIDTVQQGDIVLSVIDVAGAVAEERIPFQTFETNNEQDPNYWRHDVQCSPQVLDRELGPLINQKAYCTIALLPTTSSPQTVSTTLVGCTSDQESLISNAELFNAEPGSSSPLLKITFAQSDFRIDTLSTACTLNIFSRVNDQVTQFPEQEIIQLDFDFANMPLGEVSAEVQQKIDDAKANALGGFNGAIGMLNQLLHVATQVCQLISQLYEAGAMLTKVASAFNLKKDAACKATAGTGGQAAAACLTAKQQAEASCTGQGAQETSSDKKNEQIGNFLCKLVNCDHSGMPVLGAVSAFTTEQVNSLPGAQLAPGGLASQISPQGGLATSALFGCIPGIIRNLDKYRQIECMYADCLENAVAQDNVPIESCEILKAQQTCKYVMGEVFNLIPYTAMFDKYVGQLKAALSDPFAAIGLAVGFACQDTCRALTYGIYEACEYGKIAGKLGQMVKQVMTIIDQGLFPPLQDYCSQLQAKDQAQAGATQGGGLFGL